MAEQQERQSTDAGDNAGEGVSSQQWALDTVLHNCDVERAGLLIKIQKMTEARDALEAELHHSEATFARLIDGVIEEKLRRATKVLQKESSPLHLCDMHKVIADLEELREMMRQQQAERDGQIEGLMASLLRVVSEQETVGETVEAETVEAETVEAETVAAETVEAGTVEAGTIEAETVEAEAEAEPTSMETPRPVMPLVTRGRKLPLGLFRTACLVGGSCGRTGFKLIGKAAGAVSHVVHLAAASVETASHFQATAAYRVGHFTVASLNAAGQFPVTTGMGIRRLASAGGFILRPILAPSRCLSGSVTDRRFSGVRANSGMGTENTRPEIGNSNVTKVIQDFEGIDNAFKIHSKNVPTMNQHWYDPSKRVDFLGTEDGVVHKGPGSWRRSTVMM